MTSAPRALYAFIRRRFTGINQISDIHDFLRAWDDARHPRNTLAATLRCNRFGNINSDGEPGSYVAPALGPWHPDFELSVEPGIRALAMFVVRELGCITYSSCEGHLYPRRFIRPRERMVGILPRDAAERARIVAAFRPWLKAAVRWWEPVAVVLVRRRLTGDRDGESYDALDLVFRRTWGPWRLYFVCVERVYDRVLLRLRQGRTAELPLLGSGP